MVLGLHSHEGRTGNGYYGGHKTGSVVLSFE
jgi:hypothetical protein